MLELSQKNFQKLNDFVATFSESEKKATFPEGYLNRNIRDVLAHLHHWHLMFLEWYKIGMGGAKPDMPAKGYTWKTVPELNKVIQQKYSDMPLQEVRQLLNDSYQQVQKLIKKHSDEELFGKKRYKWTGGHITRGLSDISHFQPL